MKNIVLRTTRNAPSIVSTRHFSPSSPHNFSRPVRTTKYLDLLRKETKEPIWSLLEAFKSPGHRLEISEALHKHGVSTNEYSQWKPILYETSISSTLSNLVAKGLWAGTPKTGQGKDVLSQNSKLPSWVVLYLVVFKVRTPDHANGPMLDLVYAHVDVMAESLRGPLFVLAIYHLARFNLLVPLRQLVSTFLTTSFEHPSLCFNLLLQSLSCAPTKSVEVANFMVSVLKTMESRQLKLYSETYDALLNDRFVTLQLTKYLRDRMVKEGTIPTAVQLEQYLRLFAKNGAIHDACQYLHMIYDRSSTTDEQTTVEQAQDRVHRANTLFLAAQDDRGSAFSFLRKLANPEPVNSPTTNTLLKPSSRRKQRLVNKPAINIFDYTSALSVAVRDSKASSDYLIKVFERIPMRPTIATYTVLVRGLILRKNFANAEKYWKKLVDSGLTIDKEALTAGLQALTRAGKPHEAFATLEQYSATTQNHSPDIFRLNKPIQLTTISINEFLVALNRIQRPDIVFKLWDHMTELYAVYPNSETLSILLQAVRLATKLDDTFSGAVAEIALKIPFRKASTEPKSRKDVVASITSMLRRPRTAGPKPYVSGIWNEQLPLNMARKIFQRAIFGNARDETLIKLQSPVSAVRSRVNEEPILDIGLPKLGLVKYEFIPPPDLFTATGQSHYPHIIITNANCFNYIVLLGTSAHAVEIPLVLAWMRALKIQPSDSTLSVALVFWAEISVQAPLIETWAGKEKKSEYVKLVEWIKDWVGEERLPSDKLLNKWHQIVTKMRDS